MEASLEKWPFKGELKQTVLKLDNIMCWANKKHKRKDFLVGKCNI